MATTFDALAPAFELLRRIQTGNTQPQAPRGLPMGDDNPFGDGADGDGGAHPDFNGNDGNRYTWDAGSGEYVVAPGSPRAVAEPGTSIGVRPQPKSLPSSIPDEYRDQFELLRLYDASTDPLNQVDLNSPEGQAEVDAAVARVQGGSRDPRDINILKAAGLITTSDATDALFGDTTGGGGGSGVGYAQLAYAKERDKIEDAYRLSRDQVSDQIAYLQGLGNRQGREDELSALRNKSFMDALPYAVDPSVQYFPSSGLSAPMKINHRAYNPNAVGAGNSFDAQIDAAMAELQQLTGAGRTA